MGDAHDAKKVTPETDEKVPPVYAKLLGEGTVRVSVAELRLHRENPRRGNVTAIRDSLSTNGLYVPLTVNRRTMEVLRGNHTLRAARELGWTLLDVYFVD